MGNQVKTIEEAIEEVTCGCVGCISVPLSILALEIEVPLAGWDGMLEQLGIRVTADHIGRAVISAAAARQILNTVRRRDKLAAEDHARRSAVMAAKHPVRAGGIPRPPEADPSMTAFEVMLSVDAEKPDPNKRLSPMAEFLEENFGKPVKVEGRRERR